MMLMWFLQLSVNSILDSGKNDNKMTRLLIWKTNYLKQYTNKHYSETQALFI